MNRPYVPRKREIPVCRWGKHDEYIITMYHAQGRYYLVLNTKEGWGELIEATYTMPNMQHLDPRALFKYAYGSMELLLRHYRCGANYHEVMLAPWKKLLDEKPSCVIAMPLINYDLLYVMRMEHDSMLERLG